MYKEIRPNGVIARSVHPFPTERLRDRHAAAFLMWSWQFTIRRNIGGLFKKGQW